MRAFGSEHKRTFHDCRVVSAGGGKGRKIHYTVGVKSRKAARRSKVEDGSGEKVN